MPHASVTLALSAPVDVPRTLGPLRRGHRDPAYRTVDGAVWRATRTASGPATVRVTPRGPRAVDVDAWGPGAADAVAAAPGMLGEHDDLQGFDPGAVGRVRDAHRRFHTVRMARTGLVLEALVPAVLEQRVITHTAHDAWRYLLVRHGEPAPGPAPEGMRVPPSAQGWARVPVWDFHQAGVDRARYRAVLAAARVAGRLEESVAHGPDETWRRLLTVPGIGPWTAAECVQRALGHPDAVSVGDYHLPNLVCWALTGRRGDDARMLELLEPYRGHRYRVVRYLLLDGAGRAPRYGPRLTVEDHRRR